MQFSELFPKQCLAEYWESAAHLPDEEKVVWHITLDFSRMKKKEQQLVKCKDWAKSPFIQTLEYDDPP